MEDTAVFRYAGTSDSVIGIDLPVKTGTRSFSVGYATNQVTGSDPLLRATAALDSGADHG